MSREIVTGTDVTLEQDEKGRYIVSRTGQHSYALKPESRTYAIIKILDNRCLAQQRRYECANEIIDTLHQRLVQIEDSLLYRILHKFGFLS